MSGCPQYCTHSEWVALKHTCLDARFHALEQRPESRICFLQVVPGLLQLSKSFDRQEQNPVLVGVLFGAM